MLHLAVDPQIPWLSLLPLLCIPLAMASRGEGQEETVFSLAEADDDGFEEFLEAQVADFRRKANTAMEEAKKDPVPDRILMKDLHASRYTFVKEAMTALKESSGDRKKFWAGVIGGFNSVLKYHMIVRKKLETGGSPPQKPAPEASTQVCDGDGDLAKELEEARAQCRKLTAQNEAILKEQDTLKEEYEKLKKEFEVLDEEFTALYNNPGAPGAPPEG